VFGSLASRRSNFFNGDFLGLLPDRECPLFFRSLLNFLRAGPCRNAPAFFVAYFSPTPPPPGAAHSALQSGVPRRVAYSRFVDLFFFPIRFFPVCTSTRSATRPPTRTSLYRRVLSQKALEDEFSVFVSPTIRSPRPFSPCFHRNRTALLVKTYSYLRTSPIPDLRSISDRVSFPPIAKRPSPGSLTNSRTGVGRSRGFRIP